MKVLVIEDDMSVRETVGMVLEASGHEVVLLESGVEALRYLEKNWPDALLLDLTLPEMSGEEIYAAIVKKFKKIPPTVILSAAQRGEDRTLYMPGALFLAKPYTIEDLESVLNQVVKARGAA